MPGIAERYQRSRIAATQEFMSIRQMMEEQKAREKQRDDAVYTQLDSYVKNPEVWKQMPEEALKPHFDRMDAIRQKYGLPPTPRVNPLGKVAAEMMEKGIPLVGKENGLSPKAFVAMLRMRLGDRYFEKSAFDAQLAKGITSKPMVEKPTTLASEEEPQFKTDYEDYAKRNKLNADPDAPEHFYDYRGAWKAGKFKAGQPGEVSPQDGKEHLPDDWKLPGHPTRSQSGILPADEFYEQQMAQFAPLSRVSAEQMRLNVDDEIAGYRAAIVLGQISKAELRLHAKRLAKLKNDSGGYATEEGIFGQMSDFQSDYLPLKARLDAQWDNDIAVRLARIALFNANVDPTPENLTKQVETMWQARIAWETDRARGEAARKQAVVMEQFWAWATTKHGAAALIDPVTKQLKTHFTDPETQFYFQKMSGGMNLAQTTQAWEDKTSEERRVKAEAFDQEMAKRTALRIEDAAFRKDADELAKIMREAEVEWRKQNVVFSTLLAKAKAPKSKENPLPISADEIGSQRRLVAVYKQLFDESKRRLDDLNAGIAGGSSGSVDNRKQLRGEWGF